MWLKKAFQTAEVHGAVPKTVFTNDDAIAKFGVGKNMVASIRHWALACEVLKEDEHGFYSVPLRAKAIFSDDGLDPYSENPATAWYVHWLLAGKGNRATTWYWLFNHVTSPSFGRDDLEKPHAEFAALLDPKRKLSSATLSRDIETCLRGYAPRMTGASPEDFAESMLGELGLISEDRKGHFAFRRGPKPTLHNAIFAYALLDFWERQALGMSSLGFEQVAYGEGAPGRVFKLDEDSVAERLHSLEELTKGTLSWTDTAGLRQIHRRKDVTETFKTNLIKKAYD